MLDILVSVSLGIKTRVPYAIQPKLRQYYPHLVSTEYITCIMPLTILSKLLAANAHNDADHPFLLPHTAILGMSAPARETSLPWPEPPASAYALSSLGCIILLLSIAARISRCDPTKPHCKATLCTESAEPIEY